MSVSCRTLQAVDLALPCPLYCQKDSNTSQLRGGGGGTEKILPSNPPFTSYITIHSMNTLDQIYTSYQHINQHQFWLLQKPLYKLTEGGRGEGQPSPYPLLCLHNLPIFQHLGLYLHHSSENIQALYPKWRLSVYIELKPCKFKFQPLMLLHHILPSTAFYLPPPLPLSSYLCLKTRCLNTWWSCYLPPVYTPKLHGVGDGGTQLLLYRTAPTTWWMRNASKTGYISLSLNGQAVAGTPYWRDSST